MLFSLISLTAAGQSGGRVGDSTKASGGASNQSAGEDLIDVAHRVFHPKRKNQDSTPKRQTSKLHISAVPAAGYTLQTGFAVLASGNAVFYTAGQNKVRPSTIQTSITFTEKNQILLPLQTNLWFRENKYNLTGDWRILRYPQSIFLLGGRSSEDRSYTINYTYIRLYTSLLARVKDDFYAGGGVNYDNFFNIEEIIGGRQRTTQFQRYGGLSNESSLGFTLNLLYDSRRTPINADGGYYGSLIFRQNFNRIGNSRNWNSLVIDLRDYINLHSLHSVLALWSYNWLTVAGKPPFFNLPNTGGDAFNNTGRGYIQSRFRDRQMLYFESEYRQRVTRNGLFGLTAFANVQSFSPTLSTELSSFSPGYGFGLRLKLNKFSGTNIALDYGFGIKSRGLFVNLGEVF